MLGTISQFIYDNDGSNRGFLSAFKYKLLFSLDFYRPYQQIGFNVLHRLVFICSSSICGGTSGKHTAKAKCLHCLVGVMCPI
jgi:hypothetical protein